MSPEIWSKEKRIRSSMLLLAAFAFLAMIFFFENRMNAQNTTALALSYKYGFVPRGFVGSVLQAIKVILGIDLYTYHKVFLFTGLITGVYYLILFVFYGLCLKKVQESNLKLVEIIILFLSLFMFSEYLTWNNFGRLDEYLMMIVLLSLILLVLEKWEFLLIPLCIIACLIHVGFVFTNVNVILVVLLWKALQKEGKERKKYIFLFAGCFLSVSALFVYFQLLQEPFSMEAYEEIVMLAKSISEDGKSISDSLLDSEILKLDVFQDEWVWHTKNYVEFPIFVILFWPYIYIACSFFKGLLKKAETSMETWKYVIVMIGTGTILPSLILKVDYGRWMFCIITYYCFIVLLLVVLGDQKLIEQCGDTMTLIKQKVPCYWLLVIYPLLFVPFRDVYISDVTTRIMDFVAPILGIW